MLCGQKSLQLLTGARAPTAEPSRARSSTAEAPARAPPEHCGQQSEGQRLHRGDTASKSAASPGALQNPCCRPRGVPDTRKETQPCSAPCNKQPAALTQSSPARAGSSERQRRWQRRQPAPRAWCEEVWVPLGGPCAAPSPQQGAVKDGQCRQCRSPAPRCCGSAAPDRGWQCLRRKWHWLMAV